jgi:LPPG:FO 2-phospho-L-lactate transferase
MRVTQLSGGVGGARLARGFNLIPGVDLTVVVNVGDDLPYKGLYVSPDLDTVTYTLAGMEGPQGWGRADDTFSAHEEMVRLGSRDDFKVGDADLGLKLLRTEAISQGVSLSAFTDDIRMRLGIRSRIIPATDDSLSTVILTADGLELDFREYFVARRHQDQVEQLRFVGAETSDPAPGVLEAIESSDLLVIGPSNPPLSIWPILAVPGIEDRVRAHPRVVAVSPLIGGKPVKGPADRVIRDLGYGTGTRGVLSCYVGLLNRLVVDQTDHEDERTMNGVDVRAMDTMIKDPERATALASAILEL